MHCIPNVTQVYVHMKLDPGLLWQKQHSTKRRLKFKEETSQVLHTFGAQLCKVLKLRDTSESRSEIPGNLVL
jgi:hypothetical protein